MYYADDQPNHACIRDNVQDRRNDFDVTNTVQVSSPAAVRNAVQKLFADAFPGTPFDRLWLAFYDFERLYDGRFPGYYGCDTTYHDSNQPHALTTHTSPVIAYVLWRGDLMTKPVFTDPETLP